MFNDDTNFNRQRRNVMVSGLMLCVLDLFSTASINKFNGFGIELTFKPCSIGVLWAMLNLYFVWRMYQMSNLEEPRKRRTTMWRDSFEVMVRQKILKSKKLNDYVSSVIEAYASKNPDATDKPNMKNTYAVLDTPSNARILKIIVQTNIRNEVGDSLEIAQYANPFILKNTDYLYIKAYVRNWLVLFIRTEYFTEYTLPYLIGFFSITLECFTYIHCKLLFK